MKVDQDSGAITLDVPNFDQLHQQLKALEDSGKINGIAVVSVAGAFRKGKSFLLDLFIHYLSKPAGSQNGSSRCCVVLEWRWPCGCGGGCLWTLIGQKCGHNLLLFIADVIVLGHCALTSLFVLRNAVSCVVFNGPTIR